MNRNELRPRRRVGRTLTCETLEGRALLSGLGPSLASSTAGDSAVINALLGGAGHEFVTLALKEVKNPMAVAAGFGAKSITQYTVRGLVMVQPHLQPAYAGLPLDTLALNTAGAVVLKKQKMELGAIVRAPFTTSSTATDITFALNRGAGARLGPYFASRPGITPDVLVTVTVGPHGQGNSAVIHDLTTGRATPIASPVIAVAGPTVRILLDTSQIPSEGFALKHYTFAAWSSTKANPTIENVGSFAPADSMIPVGIETNVSPTL